jgi:hypothetical protein
MHDPATDDDDHDAYSPDELQTMIEPTSYLAAKVEQAKAKHGPDSRVARAIEAAWDLLDEELEINASEAGYAVYEDAMEGNVVPVPTHPGTGTLQ